MTGAGRLRNWVHVRLSGWPPVGDAVDRRGPFAVTTQSDNTTTYYRPAKSGPSRCAHGTRATLSAHATAAQVTGQLCDTAPVDQAARQHRGGTVHARDARG